MLGQQTRMKRRAAMIALLALVSFLVCLGGVGVAAWMTSKALDPALDLEPLAVRLRQSVLPNATGPFISERLHSKVADHAASLALQRVLDMTLPTRPDILAAVIVSPDVRILAAYPGRETLVGRSLMSNRSAFLAPPFPVPTDPSSRLALLLRQAQPGGWPEGAGTILYSQRLFVLHREGVYELTVLPRPNQPAYAFSRYYLRPASRIGALVSFAVYWMMLPWWVYLDARPRTDKATPLAVFVLLTNFLGWLTYLVIRPDTERLCPVCVGLMEPGYRCCPQCGWTSKARCRQCGRPARSDWRFCPYCEAPRPDAEAVGSWLATAQGTPESGLGPKQEEEAS